MVGVEVVESFGAVVVDVATALVVDNAEFVGSGTAAVAIVGASTCALAVVADDVGGVGAAEVVAATLDAGFFSFSPLKYDPKANRPPPRKTVMIAEAIAKPVRFLGDEETSNGCVWPNATEVGPVEAPGAGVGVDGNWLIVGDEGLEGIAGNDGADVFAGNAVSAIFSAVWANGNVPFCK